MKFHSRLELFFWFIDAFSGWNTMLCGCSSWFTRNTPNNNNKIRYGTAGYLCHRLPIFLVLAVHQAASIPETRYYLPLDRKHDFQVHYTSRIVPKENVADITYEKPTWSSPSDRWQRCMVLPSFDKERLLARFSKSMLRDAKV